MTDGSARSRRSGLWRRVRRAGLAIGTGAFLGLLAAFGIVAPAFVQHPVVQAAPAPTLPPFREAQRLLDDHLSVLRSPGGLPVASTFDYARLAAYPDGLGRLARARRELLAVEPAKLDPRARRAWAINVYNFLVIEAVVRHGFVRGAPVGTGVKEIRIAGHGFFDAPLATIEGRAWSLDAFERHYLFDDLDRAANAAPPRGFDPRIHFAIVCGARGCPPLLPQLYRPATLDVQLDQAVRGALSGSKHLRWTGGPDGLQASQIFEWYAADFGGPAGALRFIERYAPPATSRQIAAAGIDHIPAFIPWDWTLNQTRPGVR